VARAPNVERIKELAKEYGIETPRFPSSDQECILCGLCVRACEETIGKSAIGLVDRGIYRGIAPLYTYDLGPECIGCGDCAFVCPTGAIKIGPDAKAIMPEFKLPYAGT